MAMRHETGSIWDMSRTFMPLGDTTLDITLDAIWDFVGVSGLNLASLNEAQAASTGEFVSTDGTNLIFSGYKGSDIDAKLTGDGIAKITVGITEPTTPGTGDLWVDTN